MDFYLPRKPRSYDFERLSSFLGVLGLKRFLLDGSADILSELRQHHYFISLMDAYVDLAENCRTLTELQYFAGVAKRKVDFKWNEFGSRFIPFVQDPSSLEMRELLAALGELAA